MTGYRQIVWAANAGGVLLLLGSAFGYNYIFEVNGSAHSLREVCLAFWGFLLPAWFTFEEMWFPPPQNDPEAVKRFKDTQDKVRKTWTIAAGVVAIFIGFTPQKFPDKPTTPSPSSSATQSTPQ